MNLQQTLFYKVSLLSHNQLLVLTIRLWVNEQRKPKKQYFEPTYLATHTNVDYKKSQWRRIRTLLNAEQYLPSPWPPLSHVPNATSGRMQVLLENWYSSSHHIRVCAQPKLLPSWIPPSHPSAVGERGDQQRSGCRIILASRAKAGRSSNGFLE